MESLRHETGGNGHQARAATAIVRERLVRLGDGEEAAAEPTPKGVAYRQAVVLVGGAGTRMRPITSRVPKPAAPVLGRPFVGYILENLARHGIEDVVLSCGYLAEAIEEQIGDGFEYGVSLRYAVETSPLGTAGAVLNARPLLGPGGFLALNGDVLCDVDLTALVALHLERKADATMLVTRVDDPRAYGLVEIAGDGCVTAFLEKPGDRWVGPGLINAGVYVLEPRVLEAIPAGRAHSLERGVFPGLAARGGLYGFVGSGYWRDIGTPRSYLDAHFDLLESRLAIDGGEDPDGQRHYISPAAHIEEGARVIAPVHVEDGVLIRAGARVGPRAVVGRFTRVGECARIVDSVVQDHVTLGPGSVVERSVVVRRARVGESALLSDAVVGEACRIGARNVLTNGVSLSPGVVLEEDSVVFRTQPERYETGPAGEGDEAA